PCPRQCARSQRECLPVPPSSCTLTKPAERSRPVSTFVSYVPQWASLAVRLLCRSNRPRQICARQAEYILGLDLRFAGLRKAVLGIHDFGVIGNALSEPGAGKVDFLARQPRVSRARLDLFQRPLNPGDRRKHVGFDLRPVPVEHRSCLAESAFGLLNLAAN